MTQSQHPIDLNVPTSNYTLRLAAHAGLFSFVTARTKTDTIN